MVQGEWSQKTFIWPRILKILPFKILVWKAELVFRWTYLGLKYCDFGVFKYALFCFLRDELFSGLSWSGRKTRIN